MRKRVFVLVIGTQKAGTSWLYKLFEQTSEFQPGAAKELHVWGRNNRFLGLISKRRVKSFFKRQSELLMRMERDRDFYFAYFDDLIPENGGFVADVTPSYTELSSGELAAIREGILARGMEFRCIFIMRDPVKRCLSAFNMIRRRKKRKIRSEGAWLFGSSDFSFEKFIESGHCESRTRYEAVIRNVEAAFPSEDFRFLLYETLFDPSTIEELSSFIGCDLDTGFAEEVVFATTYKETVSSTAEQKCRAHYDATYAFVAERFPETRELWYGLTDPKFS